MLGTIVNSLAVVVGSLLGMTVAKGIPERFAKVMQTGVALCVILIGLQMSIQTEDVLLVLLSLVIGGAAGAGLRLTERIEAFGDRLQGYFGKESFSQGFVSSTLLFCVGSMAILGSIESGLRGDHSILFLKAALDGVSSLVLTATLGFGVIFSAVSIFLYQGMITLLASSLEGILTLEMIEGIRNVGGLLIMSLGINMLFPGKIRTSDLLPAIVIPVLYFLLLPILFS
jgi:uncharacterized membrane protein YqgA involved in biofilm formation